MKTPPADGGPGGSTGRIDPPWITTEGWQGFLGNYEFVEFGKAPFASGENGGIHGEVIYASTRPFDDPYPPSAHELDSRCPRSHDQFVSGRHGTGRNEESPAGRHDEDEQLG